jgi:hypothetical protein
VTHPPGPRDYSPADYPQPSPATGPSDPYTTPSERPSWLLIVAVGAMSIALAVLFGRYELSRQADAAEKPRSSSAARSSDPSVGASVATEAGWTMRVPRQWTGLDILPDGADAGWAVDRSLGSASGVVAVAHRDTRRSMSLRRYARLAAPRLAATLSHGRVLDIRLAGGHAEVRCAGGSSGLSTRAIAVIAPTRHGFATATLTSPRATFPRDLAQARPYLQTLQARPASGVASGAARAP